MRILSELSWLWETLGIALAAAAVCIACAALICKAAKKKLSKKVLSVGEELPQPVNAKSTEMARDAAITFFNFIEFVLSVLFFMILNLL